MDCRRWDWKGCKFNDNVQLSWQRINKMLIHHLNHFVQTQHHYVSQGAVVIELMIKICQISFHLMEYCIKRHTSAFCKHQEDIFPFSSQKDNGVVYGTLGQWYQNKWHLHINSLKPSVKVALLHNSNKHLLISHQLNAPPYLKNTTRFL